MNLLSLFQCRQLVEASRNLKSSGLPVNKSIESPMLPQAREAEDSESSEKRREHSFNKPPEV